MWYEVPPTAGLPLNLSDLIPSEMRLETALADVIKGDPENIIITSSATAGLLASFLTLKAKSNRRTVIVGGYTCPLVALAIVQAGLRVVLCDLLPDSFDLDLNRLEQLADGDTLAIVGTHLGGFPCDLDSIQVVAKRSGAYMIEDAAQALGARFANGQLVGTRGDIGVFSLTRGKGLSIYEGGFIYANDASLVSDMRRSFQDLEEQTKGTNGLEEVTKVAQLIGYAAFYNPFGLSLVYGAPLRQALKSAQIEKAVGDDLDGTIRANSVGAYRKAVGANAIVRLGDFLNANIGRAKRRIEKLQQIDGVKVLEPTPPSTGSWPFITMVCESEELRDRILERLWASGNGVTRLFARDLNGYDYLREHIEHFEIPNARHLAERSFTISNSHWLTDAAFDSVLSTLRQICPTRKSVPIA